MLDENNHALKVKQRPSPLSKVSQRAEIQKPKAEQRQNQEQIEIPEPTVVENIPYMSENMKEMRLMLANYTAETKDKVQNQIATRFQQFCGTLIDKDEVLMALYLCVTRFMSPRTFQSLLVKNGSFKDIVHPWFLLFTEQNIF